MNLFRKLALVGVAGTAGVAAYAVAAGATEPKPVLEDSQIAAVTDIASKEALADGHVTKDEYLKALDRVLNCANQESEVVDPSTVDLSRLPISFEVSDLDSEGQARLEQCYSEFGQAIDMAYQLRPDVRQARVDAFDGVASCLDAAGFDLRSLVEATDRRLPAFDELTQDEQIGLANLTVMANGDQARVDSFAECGRLERQELPD